jgi:hypothetical protein
MSQWVTVPVAAFKIVCEDGRQIAETNYLAEALQIAREWRIGGWENVEVLALIVE